MRPLVTGAGGRLGHDLVRALADDEALAPDRIALDVTDEPAVWTALRDYAPEVVMNAAAVVDVSAGKPDLEPAWAVNAGGAANLARACAAAGVWLVHISCAYVFDGTLGRPYTEFDRPTPRYRVGPDQGGRRVRRLQGGGSGVTQLRLGLLTRDHLADLRG